MPVRGLFDQCPCLRGCDGKGYASKVPYERSPQEPFPVTGFKDGFSPCRKKTWLPHAHLRFSILKLPMGTQTDSDGVSKNSSCLNSSAFWRIALQWRKVTEPASPQKSQPHKDIVVLLAPRHKIQKHLGNLQAGPSAQNGINTEHLIPTSARCEAQKPQIQKVKKLLSPETPSQILKAFSHKAKESLRFDSGVPGGSVPSVADRKTTHVRAELNGEAPHD